MKTQIFLPKYFYIRYVICHNICNHPMLYENLINKIENCSPFTTCSCKAVHFCSNSIMTYKSVILRLLSKGKFGIVVYSTHFPDKIRCNALSKMIEILKFWGNRGICIWNKACRSHPRIQSKVKEQKFDKVKEKVNSSSYSDQVILASKSF